MSVQVTHMRPAQLFGQYSERTGWREEHGPPSAMAFMAASRKGTAEPYGSRSMQSKRASSWRCWYM